MSHTYTEQDPMAIPAYVSGQGGWHTITVPDDGDERNAAEPGVGLEALADRTVWLRHRVDTSQPFVNHGVTISSFGHFVVTKDVAINNIVSAGAGYSAPAVWTAPSARYMIEGATIQITGIGTASADPASVTLSLYLGNTLLIQGIMSSFDLGTSYNIGFLPNVKAIWGVHPSEYGPLLDGSLASSGTDDIGAASRDGALVVFSNGGANGYWGKDVSLTIQHGGVTPRTLFLPLRVTLIGRLL